MYRECLTSILNCTNKKCGTTLVMVLHIILLRCFITIVFGFSIPRTAPMQTHIIKRKYLNNICQCRINSNLLVYILCIIWNCPSTHRTDKYANNTSDQCMHRKESTAESMDYTVAHIWYIDIEFLEWSQRGITSTLDWSLQIRFLNDCRVCSGLANTFLIGE